MPPEFFFAWFLCLEPVPLEGLYYSRMWEAMPALVIVQAWSTW